jgi:hypothetical protein
MATILTAIKGIPKTTPLAERRDIPRETPQREIDRILTIQVGIVERIK